MNYALTISIRVGQDLVLFSCVESHKDQVEKQHQHKVQDQMVYEQQRRQVNRLVGMHVPGYFLQARMVQNEHQLVTN